MTLVAPRWDDAREALAVAVRPLPPVSHALASADGLTLAEDLVARIDLPAFDTSAMDGWAVAGAGPWLLVGEALAGRPRRAALAPGTAVTIATGGTVPVGADAVIRSEDGTIAEEVGRRVLHASRPTGRTHVRPRGEECAADEVLAPTGTVLNPAVLGLAAASGHDDLLVVPRPRAALVLFGDELTSSGLPGSGMVRDSLGPQIPSWVRRMGARVVSVDRGADTLQAHIAAIRRAASDADLVLTTGGTAAGPVDHLHQAIAACKGEMVVDSVAVRPGHPMLAAALDGGDAWLVGLPGNPQSAIVTLMTLAAPLIAGLSGRVPVHGLPQVVSAESITAPAHEDRLVLGTLDGGFFHPGSHLGSGMLRGLAAATGFAVLPPGGVGPGDPVRWLRLPG